MLKQIEESKPKDLERYEFALTQAIETTADSLELAEQDLGKRGSEVEKRQQQQKKATEAEMTPIEKEGQQADEAKKGARRPRRRPPKTLRPSASRPRCCGPAKRLAKRNNNPLHPIRAPAVRR